MPSVVAMSDRRTPGSPAMQMRARAWLVRKLVGGLDVAGGEGVYDVTPGYPGAARSGPAAGIGTGSFHRIPDTPSTRSAMSTTAMMIRPMRTMACSLPVTPGQLAAVGGWFPVPPPHRTRAVGN
jgi:hypothetical protein